MVFGKQLLLVHMELSTWAPVSDDRPHVENLSLAGKPHSTDVGPNVGLSESQIGVYQNHTYGSIRITNIGLSE